MDTMLDYLGSVSLLGPFAISAILILLLVIDLGLTLIHSLQELRGRLWRYFGAIVGVRIADAVGVLFFFFVLTGFMWTLGFLGISGHLLEIPEWLAFGSLGVLIGGRLSDRLYSHVRLDRQGYRPNPGLKSTPFYLIEAIFLLVLFSPGLASHYIAGAAGLGLGWLIFYSVFPLLRLLRLIPPLRREPWKAGQPMPPG